MFKKSNITKRNQLIRSQFHRKLKVNKDCDSKKFDEYTKKIKQLASSGEVNEAIDQVLSINSPRIYEELLTDCFIDDEGEVNLRGWWEEKNSELLPFFLELVAHCPEEALLTSSLYRESITILTVSYRGFFTNVDVLSKFTNLRDLCLYECGSLTNVDVLSKFTNLRYLNLYECSSLTNVDVLSNFTNLTELWLQKCPSLTNVDGLSNLSNLTRLHLGWCESLTNVDGLSNLSNLKYLNLYECSSLTNVDVLSNFTNLTELWLQECPSLTNVDGLSNLSNLRYLNLYECPSLTKDQIDNLRSALPSCNIKSL